MTPLQITDDLIRAAQGGDSDAMWTIVEAHESMIRGVVRSTAPGASAEDVEDLMQEGRATLIQRVRDYTTDTSAAKLSTFAHPTIRLVIREEWVRKTCATSVDPTFIIRVKRALWLAEGDRERAWRILTDDTDPTHTVSRDRFTAALEAMAGVEWLDAPQGDGDNSATLADTIPDPASDFTNPTERVDLARFLLREIPKRESLTLRAFYGIGMTRQDDTETATDLDTTPGNVRAIRSRGVRSCRSTASVHGLAA